MIVNASASASRILIDLDGNIALIEQPNHDRATVGDVIHDMAPVTPHSFKIEQHEFVFRAPA
jgi:hypothetical protein